MLRAITPLRTKYIPRNSSCLGRSDVYAVHLHHWPHLDLIKQNPTIQVNVLVQEQQLSRWAGPIHFNHRPHLLLLFTSYSLAIFTIH